MLDDENMVQEAVVYTADEDFSEWRDKDDTTEVTGYVSELYAPSIVGKKEKYDLFKFVLSNAQTKKVVVLVWGKVLITKYKKEVTLGRILHIEGGVAKAASQTYYKEANNYIPFELLIKDATTIEYLGQHTGIENNARPVQSVTFEEVGKAEGLILIEGHIKMKFVKAINQYTHQPYGCGSITDGNYKLAVHISNYVVELNFEKGIRVKIAGEIDRSGELMILRCLDTDSVVEISDVPRMTAQMLSRGIKTPKRGLQQE